MSSYPKSVQSVLSRSKKFNPAALKAVRRFRKSRPWKGTYRERLAKFQKLNAELCRAYNIQVALMHYQISSVIVGGLVISMGSSYYNSFARCIVLQGKLSVVTYLHEFAHALLGASEKKACRWSINLFQRCFPKQYAKLEHRGHILERKER